MNDCIIVVPCYNEAARLDVDAFRRFARQDRSIRFLLVDDGSTDQTVAVLGRLHRTDPARFGLHRLSRNRGKAEAVRRGVLRALAARPDAVGFWDADLATPLDAIPVFLDRLRKMPQCQMVIGARVKLLGRSIDRRPIRHYLGRIFATAASITLGLPVYDTQCGAKLFRAGPLVHRLFAEPFQTDWIFDVELLARLIVSLRQEQGVPIAEVVNEMPLDCWRDVAGSKVRPRDFVRALGQLARIYRVYLRRGVRRPELQWPTTQRQPLEPPSALPARRDAA